MFGEKVRPDEVRVELYAESVGDEPPTNVTMVCAAPPTPIR